ncbi:MAG: 50S ribosomal protein L4 [Chloroflexi bacterium]|nr:50S ribosomal protein L4 [Chloroflexota bacterium]
MEVKVINNTGGEAGILELDDTVWNLKMNQPVLHQVIVAQQANKRQGGHDTKNRSDVISSNRKLRAQKGGGRARLGDRSSPTQRGGAVAHGPHPKSYRIRIPVKMRRLALKIALSDQLRKGKIMFVDELTADSPSTSTLVKTLSAIGVDRKALVITNGDNSVLRLSAANLADISIQPADLINPLDIFGARKIVFTRGAAERVNEIWASKGRPMAAAGVGA